MKTIFVATSNQHKLAEISDILKSLNIEAKLICPKDLNDNDEPIENGFTFKENALIKAKFYYDKYSLPTIADDSGICIEYLNNNPGIHSARFMPGLSVYERNEYILKLMKNVKNRNATFHCALAYIDGNGNEKLYEAILEGEIANKQEGEYGFGYDPIFYLKEFQKTNAQLSSYGKNKISHRYKVIKEWANEIKDN